MKNTHGGVLLLVKLKAKACNSTKSNILPCMEAEILVLTKLFTSFIQKKIGYLKNKKKEQVCLHSWDYTMNHNENEDENETWIV